MREIAEHFHDARVLDARASELLADRIFERLQDRRCFAESIDAKKRLAEILVRLQTLGIAFLVEARGGSARALERIHDIAIWPRRGRLRFGLTLRRKYP